MTVRSPFALKISCIPGTGPQSQSLVEVSCTPPTGAAFAIVLDLSDSSGAMRDEASKFARLVRSLPRNMPVWLYRISSHEPATYERHVIAHIQDGTIELGTWLEDARTREFMARRGSLFRPVLESITQRKTQEGVSEVRIIVLTDGELLDAGELRLPVGITVMGLTKSSSDPKCRHWRRVLPKCPIYDLQDPGLDRSFEDINMSFYGACDLSWTASDASSIAKIVDVSSRQVTAPTGDAFTWNFADQALVFVWSHREYHDEPLRVMCRSLRNQRSFELIVQTQLEPLDDSTVAAVTAFLNTDSATVSNVLIDVRAGDANYESMRAQFLAAKHLTESRGPWLDASGVLQVWKDEPIAGSDGISRFDALVCLGGLPGDSSEGDRIVVVALEKRLQPALAIGVGPFLDIGQNTAAFTICFDKREARWMLHGGGESHELDPRNSQLLALSLATKQGAPIVALFSGPLR